MSPRTAVPHPFPAPSIRTRQRVRRAAPVAVAALVLAGCGSGQTGTIGEQVPAVNGSGGVVGELVVRDVVIAYPVGAYPAGDGYQAGEEAPMEFTIVNEAPVQFDELVSVSTPVAERVVLTGATVVPPSSTVAVQDAQPDEGDAPLFDDEDPEPPPRVGILSVLLTGLTGPIQPGLTYDVTFTFANAGSITLPVPLGAPISNRVDPPPAPGEE